MTSKTTGDSALLQIENVDAGVAAGQNIEKAFAHNVLWPIRNGAYERISSTSKDCSQEEKAAIRSHIDRFTEGFHKDLPVYMALKDKDQFDEFFKAKKQEADKLLDRCLLRMLETLELLRRFVKLTKDTKEDDMLKLRRKAYAFHKQRNLTILSFHGACERKQARALLYHIKTSISKSKSTRMETLGQDIMKHLSSCREARKEAMVLYRFEATNAMRAEL